MTFHNHAGDTRFTVFIRLPFPRGDFVEWNAAKDQALWDILSRPSKGDDIDCMYYSFDVTLQFLLQQAAWLYDRQLSQVRAQMRRVVPHSNSPSPAPGSMTGSTALGGQPIKGIPGAGPRAPSRLTSQQKDALPQRMEVPGPRRTSSTTTINQIRSQEKPPQPETVAAETGDAKRNGHGRQPSINKSRQALPPPLHRSPTLEEEDPSSGSSEESDSDEDIMMSRTGPRFKRFSKFSTHRPGLRDDEDDEDESPAFLPLTREPAAILRDSSRQDLNATLRLEAEQAAQRRRPIQQEPMIRRSITTESSTSSVSSGALVPLRQVDDRWSSHPPSGTFSPRRTAQLARSSPRQSVASGNDASDTPSMGSSYGDLDGKEIVRQNAHPDD
ncbi:multidomain presynaptic cytomatrix related protein [Aspergillus clavatus NRRL 1]|uniref:Autophagy-related protein 29 n=1 Tax=Aspergillus clavatus (strain ATCC 1007 / CBS 513.65 / DSM 816 / NCTC 3887 / NRRL 1 / QM 1276 / 107) TaxID=344612 RepID=A1CJJ1_ASPCL|nr:uncharacterized protein ACLA_035180 [Aspergillus clavatus NRRL 1]EAW09315.1 conserved hypothetical protein [Aspergillus clavatus NRRL 1]